MIEGKIVLISKDAALVLLDPATGEATTVVDALPYEYALLYGQPVALLDNWLVADLVPVEEDPEARYAIDLNTGEYRPLHLSTLFDGLEMYYEIYSQAGSEILVCTGMHTKDINITMPDGTMESVAMIVEDWGLMQIDDFLQNRDISVPIEMVAG